MQYLKKIRWLKFLALSAVAAGIASAPAVLLARAGGGEGFGGGGFGGGGGGGGSGNGGSAFVQLIIWLLIVHPAIGIPVLIAACVIYYFTHTTVAGAVRNSRQTRGLAAQDQNAESAGVLALQQTDPDFKPEQFYQRVSGAFMKIQEAWCAQNVAAVRPFISDGVHERFRLQFLEQQAEGTRDRMSGIAIEQIQLVQVSSDNLFDTAVVRIDAAAVDQTISSVDGRVISGSGESSEFAEYWSFLRARGAKTLDKNGLLEGNCPNCGAPVELNAGAECQSCHAQLRSGQYDWVLVEITQESEWRAEFDRALPGVPEIQRQDPNFTLADLEDRVSVIFWRKVRADRIGKIDPLRKVAINHFCDGYSKLLNAPAGERAFWGNCAIGSVQTLGIIAASEAAPPAPSTDLPPPAGPAALMDQALVEIHWSGKRWQILHNNPPRATQDAIVAHNLMVLGRKAGLKTDAKSAISSAHCPNCGAPVTDDISDACSYCHAVLNDGSRGWVLVNMLPMSGDAARELTLRLATSNQILPDIIQAQQAAVQPGLQQIAPPPPSGLLAWMIGSVLADGPIDADEQAMLQAVASRQNVSAEQLNVMLHAARGNALDTHEPVSVAQAQEWLGTMISAALGSGRLTPHEIEFFGRVGQKYGMGDYDVKMLIKREQQLLYSNAVDALRQRRTAAASGQL